MAKLVAVSSESDIPEIYRGTPIGALLRYNNFGVEPEKRYEAAEMLVAMCMDNRKQLKMPENFAYIIRTGGGNLRYSEFKISYAIAIGGIKHIMLIAHDKCGMVGLMSRKDDFIKGLVEVAGWSREKAEEHFMNYAPMFEIDNEIDFVLEEAKRLTSKYSHITVVPAYYKLDDSLLYLISY